MFQHSTFIIASYVAATVILAWCALAPVLRTRKMREQLARMLRHKTEGGL